MALASTRKRKGRPRKTKKIKKQRGGYKLANSSELKASGPTFTTPRQERKFPEPGSSQCHPVVKRKKGTCLPPDVIGKVAKQLHLTAQEQEGGGGGGGSGKGLISKLYKKLNIKEGDERSLLNALPLTQEEKQELAKKYLRPEMPAEWKKDPDAWLDSSNIREVMRQYEEAYPQFKFLGPYPIDFAAADPYLSKEEMKKPAPLEEKCLVGEMCGLNLKQEEAAGKQGIGFVFNLDPHDKGGSHWVASYINIPKKEFYYFDSYGMLPPRPVYRFMQWLTIQEPHLKLGWNGRRFQFKESECGMHCMYFIDRMISGEPFLTFVRRSPTDKYMLDLRDFMYST